MIWYLARTRFMGANVSGQIILAVGTIVTLGGLSRLFVTPALFLSWVITQRSVTPFDAALPVSGRDFTLARLLGAAVPMFVALLVALLCFPLLPALSGDRLEGLLFALAFVPLMLLLPELLPHDRSRAAMKMREALLALAALAVYTLLMWRVPNWVTLLVLALSTYVAGVRVLNTIPTAIELSTAASMFRGTRGGARHEAVSSGAAEPPKSAWWRPILRESMPGSVVVQWAVALMAGLTGNGLWMLSMGLGSSYMTLNTRLRWLESLAVSRRARLFLIVSSTALVNFVLFGLGQQFGFEGRWGQSTLHVGSPATPYTGHDYSSPTIVPLAFWKIARGDTAPRITSPTGEWCEAYTLSVANVVFYNPYSFRETSSKDFVKWQFSRATRAAFGQELTEAEYDALSDRHDLPLLLTRRGPTLILTGAALATYLLFLHWLGALGSHPWWTRRGMKSAGTLLIMIPQSAIILVDFLHIKRSTRIVGPLSELVMLNLAAKLPDNLAVVALVALIPVAAMYALLSWQFARAETLERIVPTRV